MGGFGGAQVAADGAGSEARGSYPLTLWDVARQRTVTLGDVTLPQSFSGPTARGLDGPARLACSAG
jgi:hypothetical protein